MMQFNCCRDDDPVRKVPVEEVESPSDHVMDGVSMMNVAGEANTIKLEQVAIDVTPQADDTDAPVPEAAVAEAPMPEDEDEEIKTAMGAFGMADYINGKGMAKQLVDDGIYKGGPMMQFNCCRDDDPVRKVPIEEVESPNEHIMDGVSRMNVTGDANAIKLDHVAIVVPPQAEDTDAPAPEAVAAADAVPEAALPADEDEEIKGAMGAFGMADYINGKGMAKQLVNDGIYKGVSPVTLASNMGQIWKGVIGEFADATELATTNTEDKPLRGFLSHSWRSSWWAKHLCLLFTWYAAPVGFVSILSTAMAMYLIGLKGVFVYYIVFPVGLFMGPTVSTMVNQMTGRPRPLYFLDKCCI
eukprot:CAMPEP_0197704698 /NCGR_PEP_ID=MMETSP1338-20131121/126070_1 /TAXON_ID=43686 ORGANISM="Pelagodinium beii, Strain RCC1491" /NCGR_SAMPLE_ID=MMETSP1338 /ASSEMBLY_ACC=CAM_ASM_000754 /LENGTH=355 /DNA_ID=CAMNT_0043288601 /DNA_START=86 /DNA_END=1149 /DNA_ORIENTATION=+